MDIKPENIFKKAGGAMHLMDFQGMPCVETGEQPTAVYRWVHLVNRPAHCHSLALAASQCTSPQQSHA